MRVAMLNITSGGMSGGYRSYLDNIIPRTASHNDVSAMLVGLPRTVNISCQNLSIPGVDDVFKASRAIGEDYEHSICFAVFG